MNERAEKLLQESAASALTDGLDLGYKHERLETKIAFSVAGGSSIASIQQTDPATGKLVASWTPSDETEDLLKDLREEMYQPEQGAWYLTFITVGPNEELDSEFFHDELPDWDGIDLYLGPLDYRNDLEEYPRPASTMPEWLLEKILDESE